MAEQQRAIAAQVDRYTCSQFTLAAFHRLGVDVVQVQDRPDIAPAIPDLPYQGKVERPNCAATLAADLAAYAPVCVIAGQEPDVPMADAVAERLGLAGNGTALSSARRDKYEMTEALRRAGVRCVVQSKTGASEDVVAWADKNGYPVVVKPLNSAATDHVAICADADQARVAAQEVLSATTIFLEPNEEVLVQAYLEGTEYVVDQMSWDHRRYTCGVWEYRKRLVGTRNIYDTEVLMAPAESPVPELVEYMDEVLRALEIQYGPSHAEVIITPAGPTLVEVGARLAGNMHPDFHDRCQGANQADLIALGYIRPAEFLGTWADRIYEKRYEAWVYSVPTQREGIVVSIDEAVVTEIESLPTVFQLDVKKQLGGRIEPTVDLHSSTLRVFLSAESTSELRRDYQRIRDLADHVYHLRPT